MSYVDKPPSKHIPTWASDELTQFIVMFNKSCHHVLTVIKTIGETCLYTEKAKLAALKSVFDQHANVLLDVKRALENLPPAYELTKHQSTPPLAIANGKYIRPRMAKWIADDLYIFLNSRNILDQHDVIISDTSFCKLANRKRIHEAFTKSFIDRLAVWGVHCEQGIDHLILTRDKTLKRPKINYDDLI